MATPDEVRAELAEARKLFVEALSGAGPGWERRPAGGEGEEAWSPRQAAEHCIGADVAYASAVCTACGYPGLERWQGSYATVAEAQRGFQDASAQADGRLKYVSDSDLAKTNQRGNSVEEMIRASAAHFRDHAAQIKAAGQG